MTAAIIPLIRNMIIMTVVIVVLAVVVIVLMIMIMVLKQKYNKKYTAKQKIAALSVYAMGYELNRTAIS